MAVPLRDDQEDPLEPERREVDPDSVRVASITPDDPRYIEARHVRYHALYAPFALPCDLVEDTDGRAYEHFVAQDETGRVVGYARLHLEGTESKAYQVAVLDELRGRGVGRAIMLAVIERARAEGRDVLELDARVTAIGFYERLGFEVTSEEFLSGKTGTPHRKMRLVL